MPEKNTPNLPSSGTGKYLKDDGTWDSPGGGPGAVDWGDIGGTLSDQTDLQAALDGKETDGAAAAALASANSYTDGEISTLDAAKQNVDAQLTSISGLSYTGNALKVVRVNAGETDFELATVSGLAQYQVRQMIRR